MSWCCPRTERALGEPTTRVVTQETSCEGNATKLYCISCLIQINVLNPSQRWPVDGKITTLVMRSNWIVPAKLDTVFFVASLHHMHHRVCPLCDCYGTILKIVFKKKKLVFHKEVGSDASGLKRSRARSTESQGSELLTSDTLFAVTAPTISCVRVLLEGCIACSADVRVNWPHGSPTRAGANTLKLTYACDERLAAVSAVTRLCVDSPARQGGCD